MVKEQSISASVSTANDDCLRGKLVLIPFPQADEAGIGRQVAPPDLPAPRSKFDLERGRR